MTSLLVEMSLSKSTVWLKALFDMWSKKTISSKKHTRQRFLSDFCLSCRRRNNLVERIIDNTKEATHHDKSENNMWLEFQEKPFEKDQMTSANEIRDPFPPHILPL